MILRRVWAMPSKWTFDVPDMANLILKYAGNGVGWADPFAGKSSYAEFRNDLNPAHEQPACMEAEHFLQTLSGPLSGVIFDPPYSLTQVSKSYSDIGLTLGGTENATGGFPRVRDEIARLVKPNGFALSFGWNSAGMGLRRGFEIIEILIVCHGGTRNDTICTVEQKSGQLSLEEILTHD